MMMRRGAAVLLALLLAQLFWGVGCAPSLDVRAGERDSATGGVALLYDDREVAEQRYFRYELLPDGILRFGGGAVARDGETDWSAPLSDEQIAAILSALREADLFTSPPPCEPGTGGRTGRQIRLELAWPDGSANYRVIAPCPALAPLREALDAPTRVRFERMLDALPEPGERIPRH